MMQTLRGRVRRRCIIPKMRLLLSLGLIGLIGATELAETACSSTVYVTKTTAPTGSSSQPQTLVTVATGDNGQFTAIGDGISYAQARGIPTVTVMAGTYPSIVVSATPSVTVLGQTLSENDYTQNEVVVSGPKPGLTIPPNAEGMTFKNIDFVNTASDDGAVVLNSGRNGFYSCRFNASRSSGLIAHHGLGVVANSYIEAGKMAISGAANLYVYNTAIVLTESSARVITSRGTTSDHILYNSTIVIDRCIVDSKPGTRNIQAYLTAATGPGSVALVRNSALGDLISPTGAHVDEITQDPLNFYGEFANTGVGSYPYHAEARAEYITLLQAVELSRYSLSAVLADGNPDFATSDTAWIDSAVVSAIEAADVTRPLSDSETSTSSPATTSSGTSPSVPIYVVSSDPSDGEYRNVTSAISAIPDDGRDYTIFIKGGTYQEQISIKRKGRLTLWGESAFRNDFTRNTVTIVYSSGVPASANEDEDAPVIDLKNDSSSAVSLYNINFENTYSPDSDTAVVAANFYGNLAAYGCSFIGYKSTLVTNEGRQVFSNCYVKGDADFIWGFSTAYFHRTKVVSNIAGASIAAHGRASSAAPGGFVFDTCTVTYSNSYGNKYGNTYLGKPLSEYSRVIFMNSYLDRHVAPRGWTGGSESSLSIEHVTFGEYNNSGPGKWSDERAPFATELTNNEAASYALQRWIGEVSWLDMTAYNLMPSYDVTGQQLSSTKGEFGTKAHPKSGVKAPDGAVLVSMSGSVHGSYSTLSDAVASLPSDDSTQVIFVYPGAYEEQVSLTDRAGPVIIIGYGGENPGQTFTENTVTITFSRGISVSNPLTGNVENKTATISTTSSRIAMYNINFINTANLDGKELSYVTLTAGIYGSQTAFYGCSFIGWEETLLTDSPDGYQYYESSYIEGAIDIISGSSKAYFKGCTIGAKKQGSALTAQDRASGTATGGFIFDQCYFDWASGHDDESGSVFLGRPSSPYALVVIKNSYLTNAINPSGWTMWSSTDPRTEHVTFAEFNNTGPGNWEQNEAARKAVGYCELLTTDAYRLDDVMASTDWIDFTYWDQIVTPSDPPGSLVSSSSANLTYDGTTPPEGAYVVSKTNVNSTGTYETIQAALNDLPKSSNQSYTVFIYPGTYDEQLKIESLGTITLIGYSESTGDYSRNQVSIRHGSKPEQGASADSGDGATLQTVEGFFQAVNINFVNTRDAQAELPSPGLTVMSSSYASFYGCQVSGKRGSLSINGYLFMTNSYVQGNNDIVRGSGAGYLLNTTLAPGKEDTNITANSRASSSSETGFIFDQCRVTDAHITGSSTGVSLGRPQSPHARVVYVYSYLDECVEDAGWKIWSSSDPRTDDVLFGEFANYGPGSGTSRRVSFATQLEDRSLVEFELQNFFFATTWIDFTRVTATPFAAGRSGTNPESTPSTTSSTGIDAETSTGVAPSGTDPVTGSTGSETDTGTATGISSTLSTESIIASTITTIVTTIDATSYVTETPEARTSTIQSTTIVDQTIDEVTETITERTTVSRTATSTMPNKTSTKTSIITVNESTVTPDPITRTLTDDHPTTVTQTVPGEDHTKTLSSTVTTTRIITADFSSMESTQTITKTIFKSTGLNTKAKTSTITITVGRGGVSTAHAGPTTITSTQTKTKTTTTDSIRTIPCTPVSQNHKRDMLLPHDHNATTTVTVFSTRTDFGQTITETLSPSTVYITKGVTSTEAHPARTTTLTITLLDIELFTATIPASTIYVTTTHLSLVGKSTTLEPLTVTRTLINSQTMTSLLTLEGSTVLSTSLTTLTATSTTRQSPTTRSVTATNTVTSTLTLPVVGSIVFETSTYHKSPSTTVTMRETSTETKVIQTTLTATKIIRKVPPDAKPCATTSLFP